MIDLLDVNGPLGARGGEAPGIGGRNVDHLCLRIDQFDELVIQSHLRSFGLSAEPAQLRYGGEGTGKSSYFFDPDGNQIELKGPSCPSTQPPLSGEGCHHSVTGLQAASGRNRHPRGRRDG